jgi:hypothetical protein
MTIQSSGAISFSDLQTEFGGSNPISFSEYYYDAEPRLTTRNNLAVPYEGSQIDLSDFYDKWSGIEITYEIIGGGGGGSSGEIGNDTPTGVAPHGQSGGHTTIELSSGKLFFAGLALGDGWGGGGGNGNRGNSFPDGSLAGTASHYGAGGAGGQNSDSGNHTNGASPAASAYGAGGGSGGTSFETNSSGYGGGDGNFATQRLYVTSGTVLDITVGAGGAGGTAQSGVYTAGGAGADGYVKLTRGNDVQEYTSSGSYTYTVPS